METLKSKCQLENTFDMEIQSGRLSPQFKILINLRNPIVDKEYVTTAKSVVQITKAYPEFNKEGTPSENHCDLQPKRNTNMELNTKDIAEPKKPQNSSNKREENKKNEAEKKIESKGNTSAANNQVKKEVEKIDPSEFSKEDIDEPDNQDNMMSIKYMESMISKIDQQIKNIEGRPPQKLRQKFLQTKVRYNTLKEQIMEGAITIENYVGILNKQIQKDKRLLAYFKQIESKEKVSIVLERLNIILKEVEETMPHLKK